jgi:hypothetical protein
MDGAQLRDLIGQKRPRYKEQYRTLIESISKKGDASGKGDFSSFGAVYQTYMLLFRQAEFHSRQRENKRLFRFFAAESNDNSR